MTNYDKYSKLPWLLYKVVSGSRAYNLHSQNSDYDIRGVYLADLHDAWSIDDAPEGVENKADPNDVDLWEIRKYIKLLSNCNPNIIETLWIDKDNVLYEDHDFREMIIKNRHEFVTKSAEGTFLGYAYAQSEKTKRSYESGNGINWKNAMHCMRLLMSARNIFIAGEPLVRIDDSEREWLFSIRRGDLSYDYFTKTFEYGILQVKDLAKASALPNKINKKFVDQLIFDMRILNVKRNLI
jgi:hypothetical protein